MLPHVQSSHHASKTWQSLFLSMLPTINNCLRFAFCRLPFEQRDEAVQAALAHACIACAGLVAQGRSERVFPTALSRYAVARVREGRMVGGSLSVHDAMSRYAQRKKRLYRLWPDGFRVHENQWLESLRDSDRTPVPDKVWFRIDFPEWLAMLPERMRQVAQLLAAGFTTNEVARTFAISAGRVSQMRRELRESWLRLQGEFEPTLALKHNS